MAKLSQLINQYTVTFTATRSREFTEFETQFYGPESQKWEVIVSTIPAQSGDPSRSVTGTLFFPKSHVIKPSDNKYHPRYGADIAVETPAGIGTQLSEEWWYKYGLPIKPRLDEVAIFFGDMAFSMQNINSFDDYCTLKKLDNDSLRANQQYLKDLATLDSLKVFLGAAYDLFLNAEIDI
jgi:hypothetical protein